MHVFNASLFIIAHLFQIEDDTCTENEFAEIMESIRSLNSTQFVEDIVVHHVERYIRSHVAPAFWEKFKNTEDNQRGFELFKSAVDGLYTSLTKILPIFKKIDYLRQNKDAPNGRNETEAQFRLIVRVTLLSQLPLDHEHIVEQFYKIAFNVFCNSDNNSTQGELQEF